MVKLLIDGYANGGAPSGRPGRHAAGLRAADVRAREIAAYEAAQPRAVRIRVPALTSSAECSVVSFLSGWAVTSFMNAPSAAHAPSPISELLARILDRDREARGGAVASTIAGRQVTVVKPIGNSLPDAGLQLGTTVHRRHRWP